MYIDYILDDHLFMLLSGRKRAENNRGFFCPRKEGRKLSRRITGIDWGPVRSCYAVLLLYVHSEYATHSLPPLKLYVLTHEINRQFAIRLTR